MNYENDVCTDICRLFHYIEFDKFIQHISFSVTRSRSTHLLHITKIQIHIYFIFYLTSIPKHVYVIHSLEHVLSIIIYLRLVIIMFSYQPVHNCLSIQSETIQSSSHQKQTDKLIKQTQLPANHEIQLVKKERGSSGCQLSRSGPIGLDISLGRNLFIVCMIRLH